MSILIKGAEMPKSCGYCFFNDFNICQIEHFTVADAVYHEERHEDCPLVEIPPHGDLIDRDKLFYNTGREIPRGVYPVVDYVIDNAPTVIESEEEDE